MTQINTNVQSLIAQRVLGQNNQSLNRTLERLSTGLRINRGKDDPAGLIASENLRAEITATNAAISNSERADQVVNIAEGGLGEVASLLNEIEGLLTSTANTAGLSQEEKEANQQEIDSILQSIDRLAGNTNFQGTKLLNGNFDFQVSSVNANIDDFSINAAKFEGDSQSVDLVVTQSAQRGQLFLDFGGASLDLGGAGDNNGATSAFVVEIGGALGNRELSFASGTTNAEFAAAVNTFSDVTGVEASANGTGVTLLSQEFGDDNFVSARIVDDGQAVGGGIDTFLTDDANTLAGSPTAFNSTNATNGIRDEGQDIGGTINGTQATADGRTLRVNTDVLDVELTLNASQAEQRGSLQAFSINGGGATFQIGANIDISTKASIGIQDVAVRKLGQSEDPNNAGSFRFLDDLGSGKALNVVDGNLDEAQKVISKSINEVSELRGRLGAFQKNTLNPTIRNLGVAVENTEAAKSIIRDADFANETAELTRSQILSQAASNSLLLANQQPQQVLQLLG